MLQKILIILVTCSLLLVSAPPAHAASNWLGTNCVGKTGETTDVPTIAGLECLFQNVLSIILAIIGLAAFVMVIISGFNFLTAGEDAKKAEAAKSSLTLAIGGVALAFVAWFILLFISNFTGNKNLLEFQIEQNSGPVNENMPGTPGRLDVDTQ